MARQAGHAKQKKNLYLRRDICERYDLFLTPIGQDRPPHGAWSKLVEKLLRIHWKELPEEQKAFIEQQLSSRKEKDTKEVLKLLNM